MVYTEFFSLILPFEVSPFRSNNTEMSQVFVCYRHFRGSFVNHPKKGNPVGNRNKPTDEGARHPLTYLVSFLSNVRAQTSSAPTDPAASGIKYLRE